MSHCTIAKKTWRDQEEWWVIRCPVLHSHFTLIQQKWFGMIWTPAWNKSTNKCSTYVGTTARCWKSIPSHALKIFYWLASIIVYKLICFCVDPVMFCFVSTCNSVSLPLYFFYLSQYLSQSFILHTIPFLTYCICFQIFLSLSCSHPACICLCLSLFLLSFCPAAALSLDACLYLSHSGCFLHS